MTAFLTGENDNAPHTLSQRSQVALLLALAAAIVGGVWWWQRPPPEPVYQGRRLSEWLSDRSQAAKDIEDGCGPAGVAWLIYQAEYGRHPAWRSGTLPSNRVPGWLRGWIPESLGGPPRSVVDERQIAIHALARLGPKAVPAIPALVRILQETPAQARWLQGGCLQAAADALNEIGPASWPMVHEALSHGSNPVRVALLRWINVRMGRVDFSSGTYDNPTPEVDLRTMVADLMRASADPDPMVRAAAAHAIGACRSWRMDTTLFDPAIPDLVRLLTDSNSNVRYQAIHTLGYFDAKGASAIARLIDLLDDSDAAIRMASAETLGEVDQPERRSATRLCAMLHDPEPYCQKAAASALEKFGISTDGP